MFHFRPRFRALAWIASGFGAGMLAVTGLGLMGSAASLGWVLGGLGAALGPLYVASPAWRLRVVITDAGLAVESARKVRFDLPWSEVARVLWSPSTTTMFVDGGGAERSLLVPGLGASAPYDLERKPELCAAILTRVAEDRVLEVESLEQFLATAATPGSP